MASSSLLPSADLSSSDADEASSSSLPSIVELNLQDWIRLNVGGTIFLTTRTTLMGEKDSMLYRMFCSNENDGHTWNSAKDSTGAVMIDRSPKYFEPLLNYLRHGRLVMDEGISIQGVLEEAKFFHLPRLIDIINDLIAHPKRETDCAPLTRCEVVAFLLQSPYTNDQQLRFQGVNLSGCDLSRLDLRNANLKFANLSNANLSHANLANANLERSNLSNAKLDGAQLLAVKLTCANLENASLKKCNFEDPHQQAAILEGCNLRGANLDGSQMSHVNLRVACLKNACVKNCDLRSAVLAGADLENCDFSGSDLQEANLRGANFVNTAFDHMMNAVHMSQALPRM
uniref:BTB domain-containing protein n=1 Tax=Plectus sambesii TaxID=2011161 RepID=A0A914VP50_9BILA